MTIIELFSGIGTQLSAFKEVYPSIETLGISEINPIPLKGYKALLGDSENFGDIKKIDSLPYADIWTYSFPCTDLSIAGKKEGFQGENSSLIYEVYRLLINSPKPKILIMENVSNIANVTFMPKFQEWIDSLEEIGYHSTWKKIKAFQYGSATIRERVFMISVLNLPNFIFPATFTPHTTLLDFLEPPNDLYKIDESSNISNLIDIKEPYFQGAKKLQDYKKGGQGNRIYSTLAQGVTLTASGGGKAGSSGGLYLREKGIYKLSPLEMCKVMGWSKTEAEILCETLSPREIGFCMGNAIDKKVFLKIAKGIVDQYFN